MTKSIKDFFEVYAPKPKGEKRFVDKHVVIKHKDKNGNGDDVFKATNMKGVERSPNHGYNPGEDEKVYEGLDEIIVGVKAYFEELGEDISDDDAKIFAENLYDDLITDLAEACSETDASEVVVEEEQIDELSKQTLANYVVKSAESRATKRRQIDWAGRDGGFRTKGLRKGISNRKRGIDTAINKLTKEDVINNFIVDKVKTAVLEEISNENKLRANLEEHISQTHINKILELFSELNEDNQILMLNHLIDEESINDVLNFIIENNDTDEDVTNDD